MLKLGQHLFKKLNFLLAFGPSSVMISVKKLLTPDYPGQDAFGF